MLEYIEKILSAPDVYEVWEVHCERMKLYGFDRLMYGFTPFRTARTAFGNLKDTLSLSNHDPAYLAEFRVDRIYQNAPMVRWTWDNDGVCSWSEVARQYAAGELSPDALHVLEINRRYNVVAGISIAFHDYSSRSKGGIGLCAAPGITQLEVDEIWRRSGRELLAINTLMHLRISSMPNSTIKQPLTPRQREALEWVADGKTTADVATIMGLTVATVEKHLRLAREALDVDTTAQAVLKAVMQKQLFRS